MKMSRKRKDELYAAIHDEMVNIRMNLNLPPRDDVRLAQVEHAIWKRQKQVLGLPEYD
jgi:hypothetical protein